MKHEEKHGAGRVTIRTEDEDSGFVDITLEVRDGEIINMFGVDGRGESWKVKKIKFSGGKESNDNDECKCCAFDPGKGRVVCVTCPCE
jgi:hypothetical protein